MSILGNFGYAESILAFPSQHNCAKTKQELRNILLPTFLPTLECQFQ